MKIVIASSEAVPFIQTGGLGDVAGNLAVEFSEADHEVILFLPFYKSIRAKAKNYSIVIKKLSIKMGDAALDCTVWLFQPEDHLRVYFIEYDQYFNREPVYDDGYNAYFDNGARFAFFSKACLDILVHLSFKPDVVLCNDWQTALIPYYLKCWDWKNKFFKNTASILAIHNISYQGQTDLSFSKYIGLNWMQVRDDEFEAFQALNLLKGGFFYADQITTVSPSYAEEILTEPGGYGLSSYLNRRKDDIVGILNGIDNKEWNPMLDHHIPKPYDHKTLDNKVFSKLKLQEKLKLKKDKQVPVFGFIGRLAYQKGIDILAKCLDDILQWDIQLVLLGAGDRYYSDLFGNLPKKYPGKVGTYIGFNVELSHLIEAGSDFFLMPSYFEPCGLNQMYSMTYGTLPIVHAIGGLKDTVENFDVKNNRGTGFTFDDMTEDALKNTIGWALHSWFNEKEALKKAQIRAMKKDFSWKQSIKQYDKVFKNAIARKKGWH